jgi:hypothetical protein
MARIEAADRTWIGEELRMARIGTADKREIKKVGNNFSFLKGLP